jgi:hypothetical protein
MTPNPDYDATIKSINKPTQDLFVYGRHNRLLLKLITIWVVLGTIIGVLGIASFIRYSDSQSRINKLKTTTLVICEDFNVSQSHLVDVLSTLVRQRIQPQTAIDEQVAYVQQQFPQRDCSKIP